jgi:hypothetical protein
VLVSYSAQVRAQFITIDPAHILASIVNTTSEIVQTSATVSNVINNSAPVKAI